MANTRTILYIFFCPFLQGEMHLSAMVTNTHMPAGVNTIPRGAFHVVGANSFPPATALALDG